MSILSNHYPEVLDELNAREEAAALAGAPASWPNPPSDEEINAMAAAAGQLLCCDGSPILEILPEDAPVPAPCRHVAAPTFRRTRKPGPKPARSVTVLTPPTAAHPAAYIRIDLMRSSRQSVRVESFFYFVTPLACDFGRAFLVEQSLANPAHEPEASSYSVNLGGDGHPPSCECKGFLRWGHQEGGRSCKHLDGLRALVNRGKL